MSRHTTPDPASEPDPDDARRAGARTGSDQRPPALIVLLIGLAVEVSGLGLAGVLVLVELLAGASQSVGVSVFLALFALGVAAILVACARGLLRGQRWARSPVATWQILQVVVAAGSLQAGVTPLAVAALVLAVVVLVLLMQRAVAEATTRDVRAS